MALNLLDQPLNEGIPIRLPYLSIIEWGIVLMNGLFCLIATLACWIIAFEDGSWMMLINPPVFIVLFSVPQIHYILKWRAASFAYDETRTKKLLRELPNGFIVVAYPIASVIWTLFFVLLVIIQYTEFDGDWISIVVLLIFLIPFLTLGPIQFFFFFQIRGIQKRFSDNDES